MLPDRLLDGENSNTTVAGDARHWIAVYAEMIVFKNDLLDRLHLAVAKLPMAGRDDVRLNDIGPIEGQLGRYERRLDFWYAKQWELEGLQIDSDVFTVTYRGQSIHLTHREFQIFVLLVRQSPSYIKAKQLLVQAWHDSRLPEESVRTYIVRLRRKLLELPLCMEIRTRPGAGYAAVFDNLTPRSAARLN